MVRTCAGRVNFKLLVPASLTNPSTRPVLQGQCVDNTYHHHYHQQQHEQHWCTIQPHVHSTVTLPVHRHVLPTHFHSLIKTKISDFIQLGCSERTAASTYQVYMELSEVKRMFDIDYKYDSTLKRIYLTARDTKSGPISVFLPICSSENITFSMMEKMFNRNEYKTINFAIVSADSTCVYYQVIHGLPEIDISCTGNKDRTQKHDHELQNKRAEIEEALKNK